MKPGSKLVAPDPISLRLDEVFSFGTVGFISILDNHRHVILTAGHIVDRAASIQIQDEANGNTYELQTVPQFTRTLGVPCFRVGKPDVSSRDSLNEMCLLGTAGIPRDMLQCSFPSVDCNRFCPADDTIEDCELIARDPELGNVDKLRRLVNNGRHLTFYKCGAATGLTAGTLFGIDRYDGEVKTYKLKIRWHSPDDPFAIGGDSGSLVWAKEKKIYDSKPALSRRQSSVIIREYSAGQSAVCKNPRDSHHINATLCCLPVSLPEFAFKFIKIEAILIS